MASQPSGSDSGAATFDVEAVRARYRRERDKRLRPDGIEQYQRTEGAFEEYLDDPYVAPGFTRDAVSEDLDAVVLGGGFCGLLTGARLLEAGVDDVRIIDVAGDFGGTWYWNRYPGAQCDIESYIYLPLLEELGTMPTEKYAHRPEIFAHAQSIGRHYGLYEKALFQTRVTAMRWDDVRGRWVLETNRGDRLRARFVCLATGPLSRPKLPGIPGIRDFAGHTFHTSRWDYAYTGGDERGGLTGLADKRVGVIGTGATAIQCVPHLGASAQHLYVFQRTPSSVDERRNRPTDPAWASSLEPGWQKRRIDNFSVLVSGGFQEVDLVNDGWTDIIRNLSGLAEIAGGLPDDPAALAEQVERVDFEKMEQIRARVEAFVPDAATAEALKPWYRQFCKRPCFHDEYLPTFARQNVTLVDTDGRGVERITKDGVVVAGEETALDCLVFATGFEVGTDFAARAGCEIVGRDGHTLTEKWADGVTTFHGVHTRGFPNCFIMGGIQSAITPNFTELYNEQSGHVAYVIAEGLRRDVSRVEASEEAEREWVRSIHEATGFDPNFAIECTPGYYNNEGRPGDGPGWFGGSVSGGSLDFFEMLRSWREEGALRGLEVS